MTTETGFREFRIEEYVIEKEPFYAPVGDEVEVFTAAYRQRLPVLLKGPTGTGKTRFIEYMSWRLGRPLTVVKGGRKTREASHDGSIPLVTVACHEDLTASDLVGRYLIDAEGTRWIDGPLTRAVKAGGICYLDEVVEARKDTTVIIHPLTDHRRVLTVDKLGQVIEAADGFLMVISYNPGYQTALKDLKHSTRQRFIALEFGFPPAEIEAKVIAHEAGVDGETAGQLAKLGEKIRNLREHGLDEGASTRVLIY
ncbi:MAG: CbbQ/NirQ/NorQ/GpvN family protein, partial [Gemmatimonadetes bacterium]|nr:CbbQ/NirQ/NorQ/GpvN family protein [Gemmatimonadota bacterium]